MSGYYRHDELGVVLIHASMVTPENMQRYYPCGVNIDSKRKKVLPANIKGDEWASLADNFIFLGACDWASFFENL